jgi:hypothetical protein
MVLKTAESLFNYSSPAQPQPASEMQSTQSVLPAISVTSKLPQPSQLAVSFLAPVPGESA